MKPYSVDQINALIQWNQLVAALEGLSIKVDLIDQPHGVPDMVFATDHGIILDGKVLLPNFRYEQRRKETPYYRNWFIEQGFELYDLTNNFYFEGGDGLFVQKTLLVGTGFRTNLASCEEIATALDINVIPLQLINPSFYHLDMCLLPLDADTAFFYPPAFSDSSRRRLRNVIPNLYEMSDEEAQGYCANSFVSGNDVVLQAGNPGFTKRLQELGRQIVEVDVSEFKKAGGGIHCLINTIERS